MNRQLAEDLEKRLGIFQEQIVREEYEMIILKALFESRLGKLFVFRGGTCLRLAYGSPRFSEDLDFSILKAFNKKELKSLLEKIADQNTALSLKEALQKRYTYFGLFKVKEEFLKQAFSIKFEASIRKQKWKKDKDYQLLTLNSQVTNLSVLAQVASLDWINKEKMTIKPARTRDIFDQEIAGTMALKKLNNIQLIQTLRGLNKPYFTVADLEKVLKLERGSLYVLLNRLTAKGTLIRIKRDTYQPAFQNLNLEKIANELYYPSYLSFESALSRYGILSQTPYVLNFATTKITKKLKLAEREIEYRQLKDSCFFGYKLENGIYIAEPEKAILDQLYMISLGRAESDINEWSLTGLNKNKFLKYAKLFPEKVQEKAKELTFRFGKYTATLEKREIIPATP